MKQGEAEKLARDVRARYDGFSYNEDVITLCDHILSGDMKREIENAAFERAARLCDAASKSRLSPRLMTMCDDKESGPDEEMVFPDYTDSIEGSVLEETAAALPHPAASAEGGERGMTRLHKDADELAIQLRGAIALLKIVEFGDGTDASFKRGWKLSIKGMENALRRQKRLKP